MRILIKITSHTPLEDQKIQFGLQKKTEAITIRIALIWGDRKHVYANS